MSWNESKLLIFDNQTGHQENGRSDLSWLILGQVLFPYSTYRRALVPLLHRKRTFRTKMLFPCCPIICFPSLFPTVQSSDTTNFLSGSFLHSIIINKSHYTHNYSFFNKGNLLSNLFPIVSNFNEILNCFPLLPPYGPPLLPPLFP